MTGKHFLYFHGLKRTLVHVGTLRRFAVYYIRMPVARTEYLVRSRSLTGAGAVKATEIKVEELAAVKWLEPSKAVTYARNLAIAQLDARIENNAAGIEYAERTGAQRRRDFERLVAGEIIRRLNKDGDAYMEERLAPGQIVTDETEAIETQHRWLIGRWVADGWTPDQTRERVPSDFARANEYRARIQKLEAIRKELGDG